MCQRPDRTSSRIRSPGHGHHGAILFWRRILQLDGNRSNERECRRGLVGDVEE